jgi:hypothetical protein
MRIAGSSRRRSSGSLVSTTSAVARAVRITVASS